MTDEQYIQGIREGKMRVFERFYDKYKQQFIAFMLAAPQNAGSVAHAEDLYRMSCAIVHNNIRAGKYAEDSLQKAKLKTYLNQVGLYTLWAERKKKRPPLVFEYDKDFNEAQFYAYIEENDSKLSQLSLIRETVEAMPMPCSRLLNLRIFEKRTSMDIAKIMGYADAHSVNAQTYKCKEKLVRAAKHRLNKYGLEYE